MPAPDPVKNLIRRSLLDRAAYGTVRERIQLWDGFDQPVALLASARTRFQTITVQIQVVPVDAHLWTAPSVCKVRAVRYTPMVAGSGGASTFMLTKVASGTTAGSGTDLLSAAMDLVGTVETTQTGSLHGTAANTLLTAGQNIAFGRASGTPTAATGYLPVDVEFPTVNPNWVLSGTNAADAGCLLAVDGGMTLSTQTADNDQMIVFPATSLAPAQTPWQAVEWEAEHELQLDAIVDIGTAADTLIQVGLKLTANLDLTTDDDQAFFQFSDEGATSTANWTCCTSIGGTDVEADSGVVGAAGESVHLRIRTNTNGIARFYINGVKVYTSPLVLTNGIELYPSFGLQELVVTTPSSFSMRGIGLSRKYLDF